MHQRINIICGNRSERMPRLMKEIETQGITNYKFWDGIYESHRHAKENISLAHKQIVEYAKLAEFESVIIGEDDLMGTHPDSWKYFLQHRPSDFDLYLSSVFVGEIDENNEVKDFCGLTLYIVHSRFYDKFLAADPHDHLDRALSGNGKYIVCQPFTFIQYNGFSSNTGKDETYDNLLQGRNLFGI